MSINANPGIVKDGLIFHYDAASTRSYAGPPIKNIALNIGFNYNAQSNSTFKVSTGTERVNIPTLGELDSKYVDMYNDYNGGSGQCCPSPYTYGSDMATNASTVHTYAIVYKSVNGYTHPNFMYRYEYNGPTYVLEGGVFDTSKRIHLGDDWYWAWNTFTTNSATTRFNYIAFFMYEYAKYNRMYVAKVLLCQGDYTGLHPRYWPEPSTTRTSSQVLTDLTRRNTITVGGLSYSNTGAISFDGVDDYITSTITTGQARTVSMVYKLNNPGSGWGPLWRGDDWKERVFPGSINLINSNGSYYYLNGPDSSTNTVHITYSYSGTSAKSYLNGVLQSDITMDGPMNTGSYTYNFGRQAGGSTTAYISMNLHSVQFYDVQLTDSQVMQNFNALRGRFGL